MPKKIAIIGAGLSGIVAAKEALATGFEPVVFEKSAGLGGIWNQESGSVWDSMSANMSKYSCMFSDFPWPFETATFPSQQEILRYLKEYIRHFKLEKYFHFNHVVQFAEQDTDGQWTIQYTHNDLSQTKIFSYLVVASGVFAKPFFPKNIKRDSSITHAHDYKSKNAYAQQTVIIAGGSISGCEIAAEVSTVAAQVIHIVPSRSWIIGHYLDGKPIDFGWFRRTTREASIAATQGLSPEETLKYNNRMYNVYFRNACQNQSQHLLLPNTDDDTPPFITISNEYINALSYGKIKLHVGMHVTQAENGTVTLSDNSVITAEKIIFCTGYQPGLNFLPDAIKEEIFYDPNDRLQPVLLHQCTLPPKTKNLSFLGLICGTYFGIIELQARWTMALFSNQAIRPCEEIIQAGIASEKYIRDLRPRPQFAHPDYIGLADSIANEIGALPNLKEIKNSNPTLYTLLYDNPLIPAQYRLCGPNARPEIAIALLEELDALIKSNTYTHSRPLSPSTIAALRVGFLSPPDHPPSKEKQVPHSQKKH